MSDPNMDAADLHCDIQAMAFADFELWISFQDEATQNMPNDELAPLYAADEAWHRAVDECHSEEAKS